MCFHYYFLDIFYNMPVMETKLNISCLQGKTAILPGIYDKEGRPILIVSVSQESPHPDIITSVQYLVSIFSEKSRSLGISVILDARKGPWKVARSYIKQITTILNSNELAQLIVLRPDGFWDKQKIKNCSSNKNQVLFITRSRLNKYVEQSQLPLELGGNFIYDHDKWIESRQKIEDFYNDVNTTLKDLDELHQHLLQTQKMNAHQVKDALNTSTDMADSAKMLVYNVMETGRELIENIEHDNRVRKLASEEEFTRTPQQILDTIEKIDEVLGIIRKKQEAITEAWNLMEKKIVNVEDLNLLEEAVSKIINWILKTAQDWLNTRHTAGYDVWSAEKLRREHEIIEMQCWNTYGAYAEIVHKINNFSKDNLTAQQKNLVEQKKFMDFVCRNLASRLESRRNILTSSVRFFKLVSKYFDKTAEVFDSLMLNNKIVEMATAAQKLKELKENQEYLEIIEDELKKEGEKLSEMLSIPVKDALCREIPTNYNEDIINIKDIMDATKARKNIFNDSIEMHKFTLEQVTHIYNYEKDTNQAIQWLNDLLQVMIKDHSSIGCTLYEIQTQKEEHQVFQKSVKDTFNYGYQLLNASLVLRQSCKLPLEDYSILYQKLKNAWQRLLIISQEQMTRLRVAGVFHKSIEKQCSQLRDLRENVANISFIEAAEKKLKFKHYLNVREKLLVEIGRMVRLGKLLICRLQEPLYNKQKLSKLPEVDFFYSVDDNEKSIEAISEKLVDVIELIKDLDQVIQTTKQDNSILNIEFEADSYLSTMEPVSSTSTSNKPHKPDEAKSDEEFNTASECTLQHSRSSSYNTASECEQYSQWWEHDKNDTRENISKEKMVLAVGLPELPLPQSVLKPSPEVPPGKIVHEVIETTHLKVEHLHTLGVSSFVLSSETVRDKNAGDGTRLEEKIRVGQDDRMETINISKDFNEDEFNEKMREVGFFEEKACANNNFTKAVKNMF